MTPADEMGAAKIVQLKMRIRELERQLEMLTKMAGNEKDMPDSAKAGYTPAQEWRPSDFSTRYLELKKSYDDLQRRKRLLEGQLAKETEVSLNARSHQLFFVF